MRIMHRPLGEHDNTSCIDFVFPGAEIHGIGTVFGRCQRLKAGGTYDFTRSNFTYTAVAVCICEQ